MLILRLSIVNIIRCASSKLQLYDVETWPIKSILQRRIQQLHGDDNNDDTRKKKYQTQKQREN